LKDRIQKDTRGKLYEWNFKTEEMKRDRCRVWCEKF
jgi:hypothetical protein